MHMLGVTISQHQTDEMKDSQLQLILPRSLHRTYTEKQQKWLLDVQQFLNVVRKRQTKAFAA